MPIKPSMPVKPLSKKVAPKKMASQLSKLSSTPGYTSGGSTSLYGSVMDTYLTAALADPNLDSAANDFLEKYVTSGGTEDFMTVNYHIAYANVLENALKAQIDGATIVGPLTYGGALTLADSTVPTLNSLIETLQSLTSGAIVFETSSYETFNGSYWHFINNDTTVPSTRQVKIINDVDALYTIQDGTAGILYSPNGGTSWFLDLVNGIQGTVQSDTIGVVTSAGITTLSLDLTSTNNLLDITPGSTGSYSIDVNLTNLEGELDSVYVPNAALGTLNGALNNIYQSLDVIGSMMANMNSTFFKTGVETSYSIAVTKDGNGDIIIDQNNSIDVATITSNVNACFPKGSKVTLFDGAVYTKNIEDIKVGDRVVGAFGEINIVVGLQQVLVAYNKLYKINNEHVTTDHHPHVTPSRAFLVCDNLDAINQNVYGQEHLIFDGTSYVKRKLDGLNKDRISKMTVGSSLQTTQGPKTVDLLETVELPKNDKLYNLVVSGSHTFTVDGYAVTGWPSEVDFDYNTWTSK